MGRPGTAKRAVQAAIITEDRRVLIGPLPVAKGYLVDHSTKEAWGLNPERAIYSRTDGPSARATFLVCERATGAFDLDRTRWTSMSDEEIDAIAAEALQRTLHEGQGKSGNDKLAEAFKTVAIIFAAVVAVLALAGKAGVWG